MAKSEEQITNELMSSIESSDNTLDTTQGPLPDIMIRPQAGQLAQASAEAEGLRTLFTLQFGSSATEEEIRTALANYGSSPGAGATSSHIQYFMRFTRPLEDITIPSGSLVSNRDGTLIYRIVNSGTIFFSSMPSFYNPSRNAYEIGLLVEATGIGPDYNLPAYRINTIMSPISGIDATENRVASSGGLDQESTDQQVSRLQESLKGRNFGAPGGIKDKIMNALPEKITDVAVIQPFDPEFTRNIFGPALDIYMIGNQLTSATQNVIAIANQTEILLTHRPVIGVSDLRVNGISGTVGYTLVQDTSPESGNSLRAIDIIVLDTPLILGDIVEVDYEYNKLLETVQDTVFGEGNEYLFNTDMLLRSPFIVYAKISGEVQTLPSYTVSEVSENLVTFLTDVLNFTVFTDALYPEVIRQRIITEVAGIQPKSFRLTEFKRSSGALSDIEPIIFAHNEVSVYNPNYINIKIIS